MNLDTKQKVLLAIYTEYQKDIPDMIKAVRKNDLGIDNKVLYIALEKLENEGHIKGAKFKYADDGIYMVLVDNIKMTRDGIEYVEKKLEIDPTLSAADKVTSVAQKVAQWGWDQFKDYSAKILAEIIVVSTSK